MGWTKEQQQGITAQDGTLLVSAAAGSGKTSVLVERILHRITKENDPCDVDRLLVVTFTKAAAAEMKQRLAKKLSERMAQNPRDRRLLRQQMLLPQASISTIHSFCSALLREHFHRLDLSPQFTVAEESQTAALEEEAMNTALEEAYATNDPAFLRLSELLGSGRDDKKLAEEVLRLHRFVCSHPFPDRWLDEVQAVYRDGSDADESPVVRTMKAHILEDIHTAHACLTEAVALCQHEEALCTAYAPALSEMAAQFAALADTLPALPWDEWRALLAGMTFPRFAAAKGANERTKQQVTALRDRAKKDIFGTRILPLLTDSAADFIEDRQALAPVVRQLCEVTRRFSALYQEKKRQRRLLDFSDLEHLTLKLLIEPLPDGGWKRTPLAEEMSERFVEIMVDEYQDTNAVQDTLFAALSRDGNNLFMVGDVKQSIYGFRLAMPELFVEKRDRFAPFTGHNYPATITLGCNFRSRETVTESVNVLFRGLMQQSLGGIDYDDREALVPAATYPEAAGCETELLVLDQGERDAEDSRDRAEARAIAQRILEMTRTLNITENGVLRPVRLGDICLLLRSKSQHAGAYVEELNAAGVSAWTSAAGGFFTSYEVALALSLLRVIDNPLSEVPLLSVLCSPLGGFSPDDLAEIRLAARKEEGLYLALRRCARERQDATGNRAAAFLAQMDHYRTLASTLSADRLLTRLFQDTGLPTLMSARQGGAGRVANLRLLQSMLRRFEADNGGGLSAFLRQIDRMIRQQKDVAPAAVVAEQTDAVRIMSIHHSKGLEFPVVFVAGLGTAFNREELKKPLLLHPHAGIGLMRLDDSRKQYNTLFRQAVARAMRDSAVAEELRVLYVATTRAREKLCLVVSTDHLNARLTKLTAGLGQNRALPPFSVANATCMGDWVLSVALRHPSGEVLREQVGADNVALWDTKDTWSVVMDTPPSPSEKTDDVTAIEAPAIDQELVDQLREKLAFRYPYAPLQGIPAKLSASALAHPQSEHTFVARSRPAFISQTGLSPAERGTALHRFMQLCDYAAAASDLPREIARLTTHGFLTEQQAACLPLPKLQAFFQSELYARLCRSPRIRREWPFTVSLPLAALSPEEAALLPPDAGNEEIVIQGIVDGVFEEDGGLVLLDYKTDHVASAAELCERYAPQLRIYRRALEQTLGLPVTVSYLYSFALDRAIPLLEKEDE